MNVSLYSKSYNEIIDRMKGAYNRGEKEEMIELASQAAEIARKILASPGVASSVLEFYRRELKTLAGIVSGNKVPDKFARSGLHAVKSQRVDAPVITEYPLTLECQVVELTEEGPGGVRIVGQVLNMSADESILGEDGLVDADKAHFLSFDRVRRVFDSYRHTQEPVDFLFAQCGKNARIGAPVEPAESARNISVIAKTSALA